MSPLYHLTTIAAAMLVVASAQDRPLLSTIATIPELYTFSAVVNGTGGNRLNPALEERFNSALDRRNYTALVPTNDAFTKIPPDLVRALTSAPAYPLLEAILRTHIAEGLVQSKDLLSASPVEAIEGFPLVATSINDAVFINSQAQVVAVDIPASNGIIHHIDQVLNPFTGYFGISDVATTTNPPAQTFKADSTLADILLTDTRFTDLRDILLALQPEFIRGRLAFATPAQPQIFVAPSSTAFAAAPPGTALASRAPSNQPLSFLLFTFGLLRNAPKLADLDFASGGVVPLTSVFTGFNATVHRAPGGGPVFVNNAAVEEEICALNGCLWVVDRILDPLYSAFGPVVRP